MKRNILFTFIFILMTVFVSCNFYTYELKRHPYEKEWRINNITGERQEYISGKWFRSSNQPGYPSKFWGFIK